MMVAWVNLLARSRERNYSHVLNSDQAPHTEDIPVQQWTRHPPREWNNYSYERKATINEEIISLQLEQIPSANE